MAWEDVGKRIAELRNDKKLTQVQLGSLLGISRTSVSKIERGLKSPGDLIPILCVKMDVSADYIYFGVDPLADIAFLNEFHPAELDTGLDILKRLAVMISGENGNDLLMKEILRRQHLPIES